MFDAHLNIKYKIQSDYFMHKFFIYENIIRILRDTNRKERRPSISLVKGLRDILDETVALINRGDNSRQIFQEIVIL